MGVDRVERRLAAILAGDIAGYSRLMSVDEEGTLHDLKVHRKELVDPKITSIAAASSRQRAMGSWWSSSAWSTLCAAPLIFSAVWPIAMPRCRSTSVFSFESASMLATL
jgi:hypothetical protein